jgi:quercetin dioxygenase-like cupin family protein
LKTRPGYVLLTTLALISLAASARGADANVPTESARAAQAIERTLQRHGSDVHRCFEQALADRLDVAGKVEVEVDVGEGGKVTGARELSHDPDAEPVSNCLLASATGWQVDGIEAGAALVLPFTFASQANQFVVKVGDAPDHGPGAVKMVGRRKAEAPFSVKILADPLNVKSQNIALTLLDIAPASRVAMHRHPHSAKILFVLKGKARLLLPHSAPMKLDPGTAVYLPAGYPHVIENMARQARAIFLQAFSPPGPERVYRDPRDKQGRADFEVIRDPGKAKIPPASAGRLVVRSPDEVKPIVSGKVSARILFDEKVTGNAGMSMSVLEFGPGYEVNRHQHDGSTEILYVVDGGGTLTVGSESYKFGAEQVLHIPPGQPHAVRFTGSEKTLAIIFYAPGGPEQRFRGGAADEGKK